MHAQKKKKILMIEDDTFFRKLYKNQLTRAGFEVIEAVNGVEGMHKIESDKPDLILLDLMMPRKDGFDVLAEIEAKEDAKNIPIVVLTVLGQEREIEEAMSHGVKDYLVKSDTRMSEVIERIKKHLPR